jgi:hypothetical protein
MTIPAPPRDVVPPYIAHDRRWKLVRQLLHDADVDLAYRVAGLLVLLFAQPCGRIVRLTTGHVEHSGACTMLALGPKYVESPPPVDELIAQLTRQRREDGLTFAESIFVRLDVTSHTVAVLRAFVDGESSVCRVIPSR